jgi:hypothetical protein
MFNSVTEQSEERHIENRKLIIQGNDAQFIGKWRRAAILKSHTRTV